MLSPLGRNLARAVAVIVLPTLVAAGGATGVADAEPAAPIEEAAEPLTEQEIKILLNATDDLYRGTSAAGKMSMSIHTKRWTRSLRLDFWSRGEEQSLIRIEEPKKEAGTSTLRDGPGLWNYLPKIRRVIKVPSSMMGGSWMGSHVTNNDLVRSNRMERQFDCHRLPEAEKAAEHRSLLCVPKDDAAVEWGKVELDFDTATSTPLAVRYFDEDQVLARTMIFGEPVKKGKRWIPMYFKVIPADAPDEFTEMRYESLNFGVKLGKDFFSLRNLKR